MFRVGFRLWLVVTFLYLVFVVYQHRHSILGRDWMLAIEHGLNSFSCEIGAASFCRKSSIPFWRTSELNETVGLLVAIVGVPLALFCVLLMIVWAFKRPQGRVTS